MKLNKIKLKVLLILIFFSNLALAQKEESNKIELKLYYNFKYSFAEELAEDSLDIYNSTIKNYMFGNVSPSVLFLKKRVIHEIELSSLNFGYTDYLQMVTRKNINQQQLSDGYSLSSFNLNLKYEFNYQFLDSEKIFGLMIGAYAEPYFIKNKYKPKISLYYLTNEAIIGTKFGIVPRGTISFGKRIYMDINIPIEITDLFWDRLTIDNPSLPIEDRKDDSFENDIFNKAYRIRIGLGIRL